MSANETHLIAQKLVLHHEANTESVDPQRDRVSAIIVATSAGVFDAASLLRREIVRSDASTKRKNS
jgi:hypothetical protein